MSYLDTKIAEILLDVVNGVDENNLLLGFYDGDIPCEDFGKDTSRIIVGVLRDYIASLGKE